MKAHSGRVKLKTIAEEILNSYYMCDWCLGRQFPDWMVNMDDKMRGAQLRRNLRESPQASSKRCYICQDLMSSIDRFSEQVLQALESYEFGDFLVGASLPSDMLDREDELRARFKLKGGQSVKSEITQAIGRFISSQIGKKARYRRPDLTVITNPVDGKVTISTKPICLFGRYVKKVRGLPQKQPKCRVCGGFGCEECKCTGLAPTASVEKVLADRLLSYFQGRLVRFTWVGGEDADSLVLGDGRPFYAEVLDPKVRSLNPSKLMPRREEKDVALKDVSLVESKPMRSPDFTVSVLARVRFDGQVSRSSLNDLEKAFADMPVQSLSRRKGKVLAKQIHHLSVKPLRGSRGELKIECDGGLSIRKLVTGEGGEVSPNISQTLGAPVSLDEKKPFDVLAVRLKQGQP